MEEIDTCSEITISLCLSAFPPPPKQEDQRLFHLKATKILSENPVLLKAMSKLS